MRLTRSNQIRGMLRAVFLDRDGVINRNIVHNGRPYAPSKLLDFEILPDVPAAVNSLRQAGMMVIVATNQPDVSTGKQSRELVEKMHSIMLDKVLIDDIEVCYHVEADNCSCRKPKPGMLLRSAQKHKIDLAKSWMVGDRWRDMSAGISAGCKTIFVDYRYPNEPRPLRADMVVENLSEATQLILKNIGS